MAFPTVVGGAASIRAGSFRAIFIRAQGEKWQTLGSISGSDMDLPDFTSPDSLDRNKSNGAFQFNAKCNMKQASLTEFNLIQTICSGTNDFLFQLSDSAAIPTGTPAATEGWLLVLATQVGVKGKYVGDGTPKDDTRIELQFQGTALLTDKPAMLKASIEDTYFESSSDSGTFHAIGTYSSAKNGGLPTNSHIKCAGVSSITLADVAGGSAIAIAPPTGIKFSIEQIADQDDLLRLLPLSVDLNLEFSWMATDAEDLIILHQMAPLDVNIVVAMKNGITFTFNNDFGIETKFNIKGGMDTTRLVDFKHTGRIISLSGIAA